METSKVIEGGTYAMLEYPFMRKGITVDEFYKEQDYFIHHQKEYREGTYKSLFEQGKMS